MRSGTRYAIVGSLLAIMAGALAFAPPARTAAPRPSRAPADYAVLAGQLVRTKGFFDVDEGGLRVNSGSALTHGKLDAHAQDVVAKIARLGRGSRCGGLFAGQVIETQAACPAMPGGLIDPLVADLGDACGFPRQFPNCGGAPVTVGHNGFQTIGGGSSTSPTLRSDVLVLGSGDANAGTLRLSGGTYVFCNLRLARGAQLLVDSAAQVFITGDLEVFNEAFAGASPSSGTDPRNVEFLVRGERVRVSKRAQLDGIICAPHALVGLGKESHVRGRVVGDIVSADRAYVRGLPTVTTTTSTTIATTTTTLATTSTTIATTTTTIPLCGNGKLDQGEQCDTSAGGAILGNCPEGDACIACTCVAPTTTTIPTTTSTTVVTTTTTLPTTTTTTLATTTTTIPTTTSTTIATTTTTVPTTTSTTIVTTTTTLPTTTTTTTPTTTTTIGFSKLKMTLKPGTSSCGGPALNVHCTGGSNLGGTNGLGACTTGADCGTSGVCGTTLGPPPAPPFSGEIDNATNGKLSDLGRGCLYLGGGSNTAVPGGPIPTGSSQYFTITQQNGTTLTLGPNAGVGTTTGFNVYPVGGANKNCTLGTGPARHCLNQANAGAVCTTDADCGNFGKGCQPDINCYFGPPLPIPNPGNPALSTCVVNGIETDSSGTADTTASGTVTLNVTLQSRVYLTGNVAVPCPVCTAANQCSRGPRSGLSCVFNDGVTANKPSVDCPSDGAFQAPLPIALNPLTTGTTSKTSTTGLFCSGQTSQKVGAFGHKLARTIKQGGTPSASGLGSAASEVTVASTFCIGSVSLTIDPVAGLPGPGGLSLVTDMSLLP
ncbi:MAG: hypothetical protein U0807_08480 [Candidatus Binatia bacterium]